MVVLHLGIKPRFNQVKSIYGPLLMKAVFEHQSRVWEPFFLDIVIEKLPQRDETRERVSA